MASGVNPALRVSNRRIETLDGAVVWQTAAHFQTCLCCGLGAATGLHGFPDFLGPLSANRLGGAAVPMRALSLLSSRRDAHRPSPIAVKCPKSAAIEDGQHFCACLSGGTPSHLLPMHIRGAACPRRGLVGPDSLKSPIHEISKMQPMEPHHTIPLRTCTLSFCKYRSVIRVMVTLSPNIPRVRPLRAGMFWCRSE